MKTFLTSVSALAFALTLALAQPAAAQSSIRGSVDLVDRDTVAGWACYQGDPFNILPVELWAKNTATQQWTRFAYELAERERIDVGHSRVCGSGNMSFYHGFEFTIFPESMLASQGTYEIHAYAYGQPLPGSGATVSFAAAGLPTWGVWRTDYDNRNQRTVAMVSCIWPFKGANPVAYENLHGDPHFLYAGATFYGVNIHGDDSAWCLRNNRDQPYSWYWDRSNSATNAATWPMSNYWVISANNELAYSKTQSGPPGQSQPVNVGELYSFQMGNFAVLGIDNQSLGYQLENTPFLSFGAQMGRGVAGPLAFVQPTGQDTHLEFGIKQLSETAGDYHDISAYVELMWGGYKRWIGVSFHQATSARFHWNWNALESFWFPGGEFNILSSQRLRVHCNLGPNARLPSLSAATVGQEHEVSIPLRGMLRCLENVGFSNQNPGGGRLEWSTPRPTNVPLAITGFQIAIEQAPGQPTAAMQTRISKPVLVNR